MSVNEDLAKLVTDTARTFTTTYYPCLEDNPAQIASYYAPSASIVYNGNPLVGGGPAFADVVTRTQKPKFDVQCFDAQPVGETRSFMLLVSGTVKFGDKESRGYSDSLMVREIEGRWLVVSQSFRLIV